MRFLSRGFREVKKEHYSVAGLDIMGTTLFFSATDGRKKMEKCFGSAGWNADKHFFRNDKEKKT